MKEKDSKIAILDEKVAALQAEINLLEGRNKVLFDELAKSSNNSENAQEALLKQTESSNNDLQTVLPKKEVQMSGSTSRKNILFSFRTYENTIFEGIQTENGILVDQRQRLREKTDFLFWMNNFQLTGKLTNGKWVLQLYKDNSFINAKEVAGFDSQDTFFKRRGKIYLSISNLNYLYCIEVRDSKLSVTKIAQTYGIVYSLVESSDCVYVGTYCKVQRIKNKVATTLFEMSWSVFGLKLEPNSLWASDWSGKVVYYRLDSRKVSKELFIGGGEFNFFTDNHIIANKQDRFTVYDKKGLELKKIENKTGVVLPILWQNKEFTLLAREGYICLFSNLKLEVKFYSGINILKEYKNDHFD